MNPTLLRKKINELFDKIFSFVSLSHYFPFCQQWTHKLNCLSFRANGDLCHLHLFKKFSEKNIKISRIISSNYCMCIYVSVYKCKCMILGKVYLLPGLCWNLWAASKADGEAIRRFLNVTNVSCSQVQVRWTTSKILVCWRFLACVRPSSHWQDPIGCCVLRWQTGSLKSRYGVLCRSWDPLAAMKELTKNTVSLSLHWTNHGSCQTCSIARGANSLAGFGISS